jgi:hypothetical protein
MDAVYGLEASAVTAFACRGYCGAHGCARLPQVVHTMREHNERTGISFASQSPFITAL